MEDENVYTQDGTVDLYGRPVLASKTGRWKACSFLLGTLVISSHYSHPIIPAKMSLMD
ncbi:hypothetical protein Bca101_040516 [Brassica carinata]